MLLRALGFASIGMLMTFETALACGSIRVMEPYKPPGNLDPAHEKSSSAKVDQDRKDSAGAQPQNDEKRGR